MFRERKPTYKMLHKIQTQYNYATSSNPPELQGSTFEGLRFKLYE